MTSKIMTNKQIEQTVSQRMRSTDLLVKQYSSTGHELGRDLGQQEAVTLIEPLQQRLQASEKELDLSPASLKRLERKLIEYHNRLNCRDAQLTDDETVQFVREIAAYLGLVLVEHADGEWEGVGRLWASTVVIPGPIRVIEDRASYTSNSPKGVLLGNTAGASWELIERGRKPVLYSTYLSAKRKVAKQNLNPKN